MKVLHFFPPIYVMLEGDSSSSDTKHFVITYCAKTKLFTKCD